MTSELINNVAQAVEQAAPTAPAVEIAQAALQTAVNFSVPVIVDDLVLVHTLANDIKAKFAGKHPSLLSIFQWLLNL